MAENGLWSFPVYSVLSHSGHWAAIHIASLIALIELTPLVLFKCSIINIVFPTYTIPLKGNAISSVRTDIDDGFIKRPHARGKCVRGICDLVPLLQRAR